MHAEILNPQTVGSEAFNVPFNEALVHQVVVSCLSNKRQGTHQQKTRAEVSGGGIKPWKQKGSGRARAGTIRSPLWRHGGRAFAARPGVYDQKINKKMYAGAIRSIVSQLIRDSRCMLLDKIDLSEPKTKQLVDVLKILKAVKPLIVVSEIDENLALASRNLPDVGLVSADSIDPVILLSYETLVITKDAFGILTQAFKV